jgi:hypothetical protein
MLIYLLVARRGRRPRSCSRPRGCPPGGHHRRAALAAAAAQAPHRLHRRGGAQPLRLHPRRGGEPHHAHVRPHPRGAQTPRQQARWWTHARKATGVPLAVLAGLVVVLVLGTAYVGRHGAGRAPARPLEDATRIAQGRGAHAPLHPRGGRGVGRVGGLHPHAGAAGPGARPVAARGTANLLHHEQLVATSADQESGRGEQAHARSTRRGPPPRSWRARPSRSPSTPSPCRPWRRRTFSAAQSGQRSAAAFLAAMHRMKG